MDDRVPLVAASAAASVNLLQISGLMPWIVIFMFTFFSPRETLDWLAVLYYAQPGCTMRYPTELWFAKQHLTLQRLALTHLAIPKLI
jgi:hypothetical protein